MSDKASDLWAAVGINWTFDSGTYPVMRNLRANEKRAFAINHVLLHQQKAMAMIAGAVEDADHTGEVQYAPIYQGVWRMMVNTIKLAQLVGWSESDVTAAILESWQAVKEQEATR